MPTERQLVREKWEAYFADKSIGNRNVLVDQYRGICVKCANSFNIPEFVDDLIQEGVIGLMECIANFKPEKGWAFYSFAWRRIRGNMQDWMRGQDNVPRVERERANKLASLILNGMDEDKAIAEVFKTKTQYSTCMKFKSMRHQSLDYENTAPDGFGHGLRGKDLVEGNLPMPEDVVADKEWSEYILNLLPAGIHRNVVNLIYFHGLTQADIFSSLGYSETYMSIIMGECVTIFKGHFKRKGLGEKELMELLKSN